MKDYEFNEKLSLDNYLGYSSPQSAAVSMLLDAGADLKITNARGQAPMDLVANNQIANQLQLQVIDPRESAQASSMTM